MSTATSRSATPISTTGELPPADESRRGDLGAGNATRTATRSIDICCGGKAVVERGGELGDGGEGGRLWKGLGNISVCKAAAGGSVVLSASWCGDDDCGDGGRSTYAA